MAKDGTRGLTRRELLKAGGVGAIAAAVGGGVRRAGAQQKTLKIVQ
jgi:hypothetical protein